MWRKNIPYKRGKETSLKKRKGQRKGKLVRIIEGVIKKIILKKFSRTRIRKIDLDWGTEKFTLIDVRKIGKDNGENKIVTQKNKEESKTHLDVLKNAYKNKSA